MLQNRPVRLDDPRLGEVAHLQRRNAELRILYDTISDLTSTLSVREVLDRLLSRALAHLDAEIGSILQIQSDERLQIVMSKGLPPGVVEGTSLQIGEGISGYVVQTGRPLLVDDVEKDDRFRRRNHERYYTASFISAPLVYMREACGVVHINNKRSREQFCASDLSLLEALAGTASIALMNAQRYESVVERAQRDALTGLANHGHMWSTLESEFARAKRHGRPLGLVMLDVDRFKQFNDQFGHLAGDEALATVARLLEANSRSHDIVARYGGEEFVVILPETDADGARLYAEKMRMEVENACFERRASHQLTISAGVANIAADLDSAHDLLALADARLYHAKQTGRNNVCAEI